eukprot:1997193-Amphidinium_carterae.1
MILEIHETCAQSTSLNCCGVAAQFWELEIAMLVACQQLTESLRDAVVDLLWASPVPDIWWSNVISRNKEIWKGVERLSEVTQVGLRDRSCRIWQDRAHT